MTHNELTGTDIDTTLRHNRLQEEHQAESLGPQSTDVAMEPGNSRSPHLSKPA